MKTAIVGMGVIGNVHYDVLNNVGANVVALCDIESDKLDKFDVEYKFSDYIKMLDEIKPDVVHICTPHYLHADMIISALEKNINVLCEKPLCIKEEDIDRILQAEKNSKAKLGVCHQNRYNRENAFVKEYLKDKKVVGGYGSMVWKRTAEYYNSAEWRGKWATEGGGVLINQALHTLDLLIWLVGEPKSVTAILKNASLDGVIEVEDTACIVAKDGAEFTFFATNASPSNFPVNVIVSTEDEQIFIYKQKVIIGDKNYDFEDDGRVFGKCCYGVGHEGLFKEFYDAVENGKEFSINGAEAAKVIRVILAAYKNKLS